MRMRKMGITIFAFAIQLTINAQWSGQIEAYKYTNFGESGSFQPLAHIASPGNWYGEIRYNYEDAKTLSLYIGKTFSGGRKLEYSFTPMTGYSTGRFTGLSIGINADVEWKNLYLSAQSQYSRSRLGKETSFTFSWSEVGINLSDHLFGGVSLQYTRLLHETTFEPGVVAGISIRGFELPIYVFKPFSPERYFVLGISYEFSIGRKTKALSLAKTPEMP
ncbi:MAG: hypothetical protein H7Y42_14590 [Chitinophagaceae bacterium]|nr:hypothetical protein [Chitinophagaceae bacterium]